MQPDQSIEAQIAAANKIAATPKPSYLISQRPLRDPSPRPEGFVPQMQIPSRALPLPQGYDPNVNQPSIGDFDGRFAQAAAQSANRNPNPLAGFFDGVNGLPSAPFARRDFDGAMVPLRPGGGQQMPLEPNPFLMNGRLPPASNIGFVRQPSSGGGVPQDMINSFAAMSPEEAASLAQGRLQQRDLKPPAVQKFLTDVAGGNYDFGSSSGIDPTGPRIASADLSSLSALNPRGPFLGRPSIVTTGNERLEPAANVQPMSLGGGLSNMAFPTLAPSNTNTFTGGLFGGNNPMNNNPMNGGGMNSNQPLSQQIPQVVQQAVTPLLQNTATQLNQGIGSMVNQSLVGGGGQTGFGGGGQTGFGGMQYVLR
jgi:hypothetical protein